MFSRSPIALVVIAAVFFVSDVSAGKYNQKLNIGDQAPAWSELPGTDGQKHSLSDLKEKQAIVVVFTCNSCPYAVDVEDRLIKLQKDFADKGVALVAINVNKVDADAMPAMKDKAKAKQFPFAYLFDGSQEIAKSFGAIYTPECYVLNAERKVVYMGALDDSPDGKKVSKTYVRDAINASLGDKAPKVTETISIGCRVRYVRQRRTRKAK